MSKAQCRTSSSECKKNPLNISEESFDMEKIQEKLKTGEPCHN